MRSIRKVPRTGRLLVVLSPKAVKQLANWAIAPGATAISSLSQLGAELGYPELVEVVRNWAESTFPVVRSLRTTKILELDEEASEGPFPPSRSMTAYWIAVPLRRDDKQDAQSMLMKGLLDSPAVEAVHLEQAVGPPPVNWTDDAYASGQTHLDAAPAGIDAIWVWQALGLDGATVGFADVEMGWNLDHDDLKAKMPAGLLTHSNYANYRDHGTAVLGLVVGVDNAEGIIGVAPGVAVVQLASHWDGYSADNVANAIETAAAAMAPGDVLLLETQSGEDGPIETMEGGAERDAIKTATSRGIVVIEAAGNAGKDVNATWASELATDSGAIMVGASGGLGGAVSHPRNIISNFGSRVDCFSPGVGLVSSGYGDLDDGGGIENREYTNSFRDTSGASAIVAGAAILAQHMRLAACGNRLSALQMRELLKFEGTKQGAMDGNIGIMPNLRRIAQRLCDVYVRDFIGDTGIVPSVGPLSSSPDVIVLGAPVADPQFSYGEGSGTENIETLSEVVTANSPHSVYVRLRNRGMCRAVGVTATVYWSKVATLVTPSAWNPIGISLPVTVEAGDVLTVTAAIPWPAPPAAGHYCFVATVNHPYDPAPATPSPTDWAGFMTFLRQSNNVTWRNFNVVDSESLTRGAGASFAMRGAPDELRRFDFEIEARLPEDTPLVLEVPRQLLPALRGGPFVRKLRIEGGRVLIALPQLPSIQLPAVWLGKEADHRCRFFVPDGGTRLNRQPGSLLIRQLYQGTEVGRITWVLRPRHQARGHPG